MNNVTRKFTLTLITFVNVGNQGTLKAFEDLFTIILKAKRKVSFKLTPVDGLLVDNNLNSLAF